MCNIRTTIQFRTHRFPTRGTGLCVKKRSARKGGLPADPQGVLVLRYQIFQAAIKKAFDPSLVRHFTAGNPRYISLHRGFGIFAPRLGVLQKTTQKQH